MVAKSISTQEADRIRLRATQVFSPRGPVSTRELFAGRLEQVNRLLEAVGQTGLHALVYGERGVGKTSLVSILPMLLRVIADGAAGNAPTDRIVVRVNANTTDTFSSVWGKILDEIAWEQDRPSVGFRPSAGKEVVYFRQAMGFTGDLGVDDVRRAIAALGRSVFIIDEFDRLPRKHALQFTDLIKALSDHAVACTIVLVGVAQSVEDLVRDHASISRAIRQIPMPRMSRTELREILRKAETALGVTFQPEAAQRIVRLSQGLPHYTHLIGQMAVLAAVEQLTSTIAPMHVASGIEKAVRDADHTTAERYEKATHSAHAIARYPQVLLAAAVASALSSNDLGYFQPVSVAEPLATILGKTQVEISSFNRHLGELCLDKRGRSLERAGEARSFRYRFRDPLFPPYILLRSVADGLVSGEQVDTWLRPSE